MIPGMAINVLCEAGGGAGPTHRPPRGAPARQRAAGPNIQPESTEFGNPIINNLQICLDTISSERVCIAQPKFWPGVAGAVQRRWTGGHYWDNQNGQTGGSGARGGTAPASPPARTLLLSPLPQYLCRTRRAGGGC